MWSDMGSVRAAGSVALSLAICFTVAGCSRQPKRPLANQRQPLPSPSGKYVLTIPIETGSHFSSPGVWKVTIRDSEGSVLYKDEGSDFVGSLNVYWVWDDADRVWLYNSDNSHVYFWELQDGVWSKQDWGASRERQIDGVIAPPESVYPEYAKKPSGA
jgi:hypothetical protein